MSILRRASTETKRIAIPVDYVDGPKKGDKVEKVAVLREPKDGEDWVKVRTDVAKRDFNRFIAFLPGREMSDDDKLTAPEAVELQNGMFELLVVGWSMVEEDGTPVPATLDEYLALSNDASQALDTALAEHFKSLQPTKAEEKAAFRPSK